MASTELRITTDLAESVVPVVAGGQNEDENPQNENLGLAVLAGEVVDFDLADDKSRPFE